MSSSTSKEVPEPLRGTYRLTDLEISFVSACPQGANPGAKVMLKKEMILMAKEQFTKEGDKKDPQVNVNLDIEAMTKSMTDNLKKALGDLLAKDKNLSADAMTEAVVAVVTSDITKMQKELNDQLTKTMADVQKDIDTKLADAFKKDEVNKSVGEELLELNGTSFKKSEVGEHAFQAIKASVIQQAALKKEIDDARLTSRVEKEYPNIAGKPEEKAALLGLIEKADDAVKATGLAVLKALNEAGKTFKKEIGTTETNDGTSIVGKLGSDSDATGKLDAMAKELAQKEGITVAKAYTKILDTPEGSALYEQHRAA